MQFSAWLIELDNLYCLEDNRVLSGRLLYAFAEEMVGLAPCVRNYCHGLQRAYDHVGVASVFQSIETQLLRLRAGQRGLRELLEFRKDRSGPFSSPLLTRSQAEVHYAPTYLLQVL